MTATTQPQPGTLRAICDECGEVRHVTARDGYGKTGDDCGGVRCMVRVKCANCGRLTVHAYLRDFDPDADDCEEQYGEPMTTVHEAAIANGWNPDDGSPWVGPDGVTYPSKDAFYASQVLARAQAAAKADNEASQGVAHRENCLCSKLAREEPAEMWDERGATPSMLSLDVLRLLARKLEEAGSPRGAKRLVAEALKTLRKLPTGSSLRPLVRTDSAFYGHPTIGAAIKAGADVSVTVRLDKRIKAAIAEIPEDAWATIEFAEIPLT